ncbi:glycosyltransferase family 1 protein [Flavipsychrobacter stenotrophus]|uniref:Glycosyltransferase family 1 protein n=1 Tax=Flavipsychrobacter stenotrophus TaxID=2077091 RepID=A0A2S7SVB1_9BACT|nr:glycosyltransferase family 1 protein [Flavipsychrobacter stenotrophus]PQJ10545.1 glycosyltransferase family 1 protein [Flavipsychrobacter stenotrophus]
MRIGVNTRLLLKGKLEGIGWFTFQTLQKIVLGHPEHEFVFFFDREYDQSFIFASNVTPVVVHPQARHPILFYLWFEWSIPMMLRKHKIDLFLSPDSYLSLSTKVPTCLVIHDLAFEHYPEHYVLSHRLYWTHYSPLFAKKAKRIATVSAFSKDDISKRYGISKDNIDVVYNGAHDEYRPLTFEEKTAVKAQYADGCEYFVFAGAIHPRKNIVNLLKAFVMFKKHQRTNMKLVIVGRPAWKYDEVEELKNTMPYKEDVKWVGYMNIDELSRVMGGAYALVYASLFEGFGIPILEAMQCDVPGIVSNTSSMPEVAGDAALLVDPTDPADIAEKMHILYKDEALRAKLIANARVQVQKFSWEASADKLWKCMMKCVDKQ